MFIDTRSKESMESSMSTYLDIPVDELYPGNEDCVIGATNQIFYDSSLRPLNHGENRYWAGFGCDIPNGTEFPTAQALFDAPIYGGRSLRDRWNEITWHMIDGWMTPEDFDAREGNNR